MPFALEGIAVLVEEERFTQLCCAGPLTAMDITAAAFSAGLPTRVTNWPARDMQASQPDMQNFGSSHITQAAMPAAAQHTQQPMPIGTRSGQQRPIQTPTLADFAAGLQTPAFSAGLQTPAFPIGLEAQGLSTRAHSAGHPTPAFSAALQTPAFPVGLQAPASIMGAQVPMTGTQVPISGEAHLQRAAAAAALSAAQSTSQGPQAQAYSQLPADFAQGNATQPGGLQTQAAFLAESLRRTRLSQERRSQMTNVPSFSDGLQV